MLRALRIPALSALLFLVGVAIQIARFDASLQTSQRFDAAIVLGAAVYADRPSPVLQGRLEYALELLRQRRVSFLIVTGGARSGQRLSEAEVAARFLTARGANAQHVLLERRSTTTHENLCFARQLASERGLRSFALITDPLHEARAMLLARALGLHATPAATPYTRFMGGSRWLTFLARETYLYAGQWAWPRSC
ncbi:MAG TPA: YdcF family protein [Polyangiales bacterium]